MHFPILALALAATTVLSHPAPDPQFEGGGLTLAPTIALPTSTPILRPTRTRRPRPHKEPTPTFKTVKPCECIKPIIPINLLTARERCEMDYAHQMACYFTAQGGCPSPTFTVRGNLYKTAHPEELSQYASALLLLLTQTARTVLEIVVRTSMSPYQEI
ncbi:hypothetical protein M011DRAFT_477025 [Sporormia fimetaria CBS 119925]|uniref:Extracellular membrane protein CFEM domain-containing protein n=1 Tax=Sporormia fimetaria CBS 119925 TaxID=1340428 RepID=A0A6A6VBB3_9PLEO|nr:hypothetical protein M011DRAFT_477025 [Sporormia fimetaria CBS 119925]